MLQLLLIVPLIGAVYIIDVYIQPIGFGLVNFSELFNPLTCLLRVPVAPRDEKASSRLPKLSKPPFQ
jgi:hypothetical protein